MSCCETRIKTSALPLASSGICRVCGSRAPKVERLTVEHLVTSERRNEIEGAQYRFCETPDCDVVYFSNETGRYFTKADVQVRVGIKETEEPITICYCFNHTVASVREEIAHTGRSTVVENITAQIKAGGCACEIKNPSGRCCLSKVSNTVKRFLKE